jgi:phosphopantetheine--protein transferase-like protein
MKEDRGWGIGVDVESVVKFRKALHTSKGFFPRTFSKREIEYCMSKDDPAVHFAGMFAAKEAAYKAANNLLTGKVDITRFEISHDDRGMPIVKCNYEGNRQNLLEMKVSISHTLEFAVALAFARTGKT